MDTLLELIAQSGFRGLAWQNLVMFGVAGLLIYLAVKKNYEPLLLIPIGFGAMLANLRAVDSHDRPWLERNEMIEKLTKIPLTDKTNAGTVFFFVGGQARLLGHFSQRGFLHVANRE